MKNNSSEKIRLDKYLANQNLGTRKEITRLIRKGLAKIDDIVVKDPSVKFDPSVNKIKFEDKEIVYSKFIYIMMNKPKGVLSATRDKKAQTVLDLIPEEYDRVGLFPAGRLDKDSTGLLIITDDGDFAHKMLAPKSHVYKLYEVLLKSPCEDEYITAFEKGVSDSENDFLPAELNYDKQNSKVAYVTVREGKFHQVKRMFKAVGNEVIELKRLKIGELKLDKMLKEGECKLLDNAQTQLVLSNINKK